MAKVQIMFIKVLFLFALSSFGGAFAQAVPATAPTPRVVFPETSVGATRTLGPMTANASNAANFSFGVAANGSVFNNTTHNMPTAGGGSLALSVAGQSSKANVAAAIGRAGAKLFWPVQVGSALYDLAKELNFSVDANHNFSMPAAGKCYTAPCYYYNSANYADIVNQPSVSSVCSLSASRYNSTASNNFTIGITGIEGTDCMGNLYNKPSGTLYTSGVMFRATVGTTRPIDTDPLQPATPQNFADAIAAKSGWPSTSALARAFAESLKNGESAQIDPQTVTGPATSPGPRTVTNNGTQTTTVNNTSTHTYAGPSVTTNQSTVTTVVNNSTGATESTTTSQITPVTPPLPSINCGLPDTPACRIDETGTPSDSGKSLDPAKSALDTAKTSSETAITGAASIVAPTWSFSFQLPTGCAPYTTGIKGVVLNVCAYRSTIHDLLSMIWAAATAFCLIGMVGRTIRES